MDQLTKESLKTSKLHYICIGYFLVVTACWRLLQGILFYLPHNRSIRRFVYL